MAAFLNGYFKLVAVYFLLLLCETSCETQASYKSTVIVGSGISSQLTRNINFIRHINVSPLISASIVSGEKNKAVITSDDNILDRVKTNIDKDTLKVGLQDGVYGLVNVSVAITVNQDDIISINHYGDKALTVDGFEMLDSLQVTNLGTGSILLKGTGRRLKINQEGAKDINGFDFFVDTCIVKLESTGSLEITCNKYLEGTLSGAGNIYYKGNPQGKVVIFPSATGEVKKKD